MLLYIIRHGDPDYTTDTLTERGWQQSLSAADAALKPADILLSLTALWLFMKKQLTRLMK